MTPAVIRELNHILIDCYLMPNTSGSEKCKCTKKHECEETSDCYEKCGGPGSSTNGLDRVSHKSCGLNIAQIELIFHLDWLLLLAYRVNFLGGLEYFA
jgi:hypothetical protein